MPSKKKKYNARFPPARIKKIMQTDEEVGKVAAAVPVIISRALEMFVESLLKKASVITSARQARTLSTFHLKQCILSETKFDFLKELVETIPDRPDSVPEDDPIIYENQPPSLDKPKKKRGRKPKSESLQNAGPSNSADSDSEEYDEDEDNTGSSDELEGNKVYEQNTNEENNIDIHELDENIVAEHSDVMLPNLPTNSGVISAPINSGMELISPTTENLESEDDDYDS